MAVAEGSAASEASGVPSESSATSTEHDNTKTAHTSSSESESASNGHVTSENGATRTADGVAVAVAVGTGVEDSAQGGEVLTAEEADKAWEQYIIQVRTVVRTSEHSYTNKSSVANTHKIIEIEIFDGSRG